MPIYEYQCTECGYEFEKLQKMSDAALVDCPQCGKPELRKMISAAGFRLKGGGWYETDFKSDNRKNIAKPESKVKTAKKEPSSSSASTKKTG